MSKIDEILEKKFNATASDEELDYLDSQLSENEIDEAMKLFQDMESVFHYNHSQDALIYVKEYIDNGNTASINFWKSRRNWVAILVLVGLLLATYLFFLRNKSNISPEKAYTMYYAPIELEFNPVTRGNHTHSTVQEIQELYLEGDYENVIVQSSINNIDGIVLYRALSFMELGEYENALESFQAVQENSDKVLLQEIASWYTALVYLKQEKIQKSKEQLQRIIAAPKHSYKEQARKLLHEL